MGLGRILRGVACILATLVCWSALPLVAAADAPPKPDIRYVVTRLGDQPPALPVGAPGTTVTQVQSFKFSAQGRLTIAGQDGELRFAMTGEAALPDRVHMTLTLTDPTNGDVVPIEMVVVGKTPYVHVPKDLAPDGKDTWVLVDSTDGLSGIPGMNLPNLANIPPITTKSQTIGDETVGGVLTTHTRMTIDATALFGGSAVGAKPSTLTLDVWTGKSDNFPRHMTINGNLSIDPDALLGMTNGTPSSAAAIVNAALTFSMDFTDLNTPVTVTPPTTYVKLSDLLGSL